ncbi:MAG TPA: DISARM system SNF2-like helicase DrmD [Terriglobia bacterium]|nr:DISARM system SNF2-like helicase DrmD [Terriglobia bacterium]
MTISIPNLGQIARVRQRLYLVEQIVPPPNAGDSTLVRMSCVDDDNQGQPLEVLWEREIDPEVLSGEAWESVAKRGFDPPKLFSAYLNTLRWNCVTATDPRLFQSPFRAGIKIDAYQLEPLRKALRLPRVNLFIADDVGLGKTIEAGLIARELLIRKKVREIVVSCPPSMLFQWQEELENRFGLTFEILDKDYMKRVRRERGFAVNPWSTHSRFLISQRLLIDEAYVGPLRDWLGTFRGGSLLILDEAHHAAPASGQKYAIDSQITRAVRDIAHRFEHRLFLSATPHNGHSNSFSALLEILDPQRFCRGIPVTAKYRDEVIVRRLKDDIRQVQGGFAKREVVQIDIERLPQDAPELQLSKLLDEYRELREERLESESKRKQAAAGLLITGLQQRLLSSIEAFARTLRVHRRTVQKQWEAGEAGKDQPADSQTFLDLLTHSVGSDDDRATLSEEELQAEQDAQFEAATAATLGPTADAKARDLFAREQRLLDQMTELAESVRGLPDARIRKLVEWIRTNLCPQLGKPGAKWNDTRCIIFTEYDDTKRYLQQQLEAATSSSDLAADRILVYHGPTPPANREEIKTAFNAKPSKHPVRILIATDAAREGLNLQAHCWNLFHFDVPWNPSRMEQRNGRIDRKLQPNPVVFCHYFVYQQRPEDRIIQVLVRKTETIREELGSLSQVIDSKLAKTMNHGIRRKDIGRLETEIESADLELENRRTVVEELEAARERQDLLREQIERLRSLLETSKKSIGLDEGHFRSAISCALELVGSAPLKQLQTNGESAGPPRFAFPALDQREGADPSWADTMDTLRTPRKRDQKPWDWRRTSPIRPVVFEDRGTIDDDVVHLHLEQRMVQRLLGRFTAQGFVHNDLSRACLAQTSDAIPRVILLGRLCLYGPGAARLHEELIPVTARWTDPKIRKGPVTPYARDAETRTLSLLEESLLQPHSEAITEIVSQQLQSAAPRDIQELLPYLQTRGEEYAADAEKKLKERGEAEAKAMREILETQKKHIASTVERQAKMDAKQLRLEFGDDEDELWQLEANKRHWAKRLEMIDGELKSEPDRIREVYEVKARRIEPVGVVYLWPVSG